GRQQRHGRALMAAQRPDERPVDGDAEDEHRRYRDQQADEQVDVQVHGEHVAEIGADNDQDALGDMDDAEHAEDQRQPASHRRIHPADQYPVDDGLVYQAPHLSSMHLTAQPPQYGFG